jgi:general L-amino acid transport system ATP-binding protein
MHAPAPAQARSDTDYAIQITGLSKWFGDFQVLKDIKLSVAKGERIVVCGPSGSGKSTLIRCINRLETHQKGSISVNGTELTDNLKNIDQVRSDVGMVFQHFNLFPHLTVLDNCTLAPIWVRKQPKIQAEETAMRFLERVRIGDQAHKFPGQLSGGQQQRVAIARALCMTPSIMLFDEPTSALDPIATAKIEELITELRQHVTILIVTHNMQQAARVSDFTAFMYLGELVEVDVTSKIFTNPAKKATEDYITGRYG